MAKLDEHHLFSLLQKLSTLGLGELDINRKYCSPNRSPHFANVILSWSILVLPSLENPLRPWNGCCISENRGSPL